MASATAAAVALHALALLGLSVSRPPPPPDGPSPQAMDLVTVTLDATSEPPSPRAAAPAAPLPPSAGVDTDVRARKPILGRASERAPAVPAEPEPATGATGAVVTGTDPDAFSAPDMGPAPSLTTIPPVSAPPDALPPPLVPRAIPAPSAIFGSQFSANDNAPPASGGAQIIGTVRAVAEQSAPRNGHGTIRVEVDGTGAVVRVTSSSPSWAAAARSLQASLAGRRLRVPSGGRGVILLFSVDAEITKAPPVLTGEAKAAPCSAEKKDQVGRVGGLPEPGCIDVLALLPLPRHRVTVKLAGEQPR